MIAKLQRRFLGVVTVLLSLSILSLLAVLPGILLDKSPGAIASGVFLGMLIHLALFAYLYGYRLSKHNRPGKKEISLGPALIFAFLGLILMDGPLQYYLSE